MFALWQQWGLVRTGLSIPCPPESSAMLQRWLFWVYPSISALEPFVSDAVAAAEPGAASLLGFESPCEHVGGGVPSPWHNSSLLLQYRQALGYIRAGPM